MIDWLDETFKGPAWHGPALLLALRGVTPEEAVWRPGRGRHNIAEIVVHAAYWKHVVRQRLSRTREPFPLSGRNWFVREAQADWRGDVQLLVEEHRRLRAAVAGMSERDLRRVVHARQTARQNIRGIAAHDAYHAGQIQLLKRLASQSP
jgi:hypothetical protein